MASSKTTIPDVLKKRKCFLHIDLDCFFAQVEQVRLGLTADVPLVSQQWNAIIAVNYAARKYGISRLQHSVFDAKQLCPEVVCAHVATIGPGDSQPDYYPSPSRYTHKVSLDPYRKASAKIFSVFRKYCLTSQKGGLDEVFMDVTDIVNQRLMDEYGKDLSQWDRASAEMINWKRDHPEAGVVFGLPKDDGSSALEVSLDDEDDYEMGKDGEEEEEERGSDRRGHREQSDGKPETTGITSLSMAQAPTQPDGEQLAEDDDDDEFGFDDEGLDLDTLAAIEGIEGRLTQERLAGPQSVTAHSQGPSPPLPGALGRDTALMAPELTADDIQLQQQQQQQDDEACEKAEEEKKLRKEKEYLLPYYGVPEGTFEEQFWAEMQILKAAEFCNEIRKAVKDELGYTCSAGIANNRLLAKLGSGMNKPYSQTIILPRYIPDLMHGVKLSKIRGLGGKFGHRVKTDFQIERASQLWPVPLRRLQGNYSPQTGLDLWHWCRGIDHGGIRKIKSKSMCSHKSFIPALSDLEEIEYWIQTMCREIVSRIESEYLETSRWPRTISLGFFGGIRAEQDRYESGQGSAWAPPSKGSRQMPMGGRLDYGGVEGLTKKMFRAVEKLIQDGREGRIRPILPLVILTVTASNFDAGGRGAKDIASFFTKSASLTQHPTPTLTATVGSTDDIHVVAQSKDKVDRSITEPAPDQRVEYTKEKSLSAMGDRSHLSMAREKSSSSSSSRKRFFGGLKFSLSPSSTSFPIISSSLPSSSSRADNPMSEDSAPLSSPGMEYDESEDASPETLVSDATDAVASGMMTVRCTQCPPPGRDISATEWDEHQDYHFALSLHNDERQQHHQQQQQQSQNHKRTQDTGTGGTSIRGGRRKKVKASNATDNQARSSTPAVSITADNSTLLTNFFKPSS